MHIFDIIGPVMIGPSSSHTAGAAKIGYVTRKLLGERPVQAKFCCMALFLQRVLGTEQIGQLLLDCWDTSRMMNDYRTVLQRQRKQGFPFS